MVLKGKIRPDSSRPELLQPVSRAMPVLGTVLGDTLAQHGGLAALGCTWNGYEASHLLDFYQMLSVCDL